MNPQQRLTRSQRIPINYERRALPPPLHPPPLLSTPKPIIKQANQNNSYRQPCSNKPAVTHSLSVKFRIDEEEESQSEACYEIDLTERQADRYRHRDRGTETR